MGSSPGDVMLQVFLEGDAPEALEAHFEHEPDLTRLIESLVEARAEAFPDGRARA